MSQQEGSAFTYPSLRGSTGRNTAVVDIWVHFSFEDSRLFDKRFGMYFSNPHMDTKKEYDIQSLYLFQPADLLSVHNVLFVKQLDTSSEFFIEPRIFRDDTS